MAIGPFIGPCFNTVGWAVLGVSLVRPIVLWGTLACLWFPLRVTAMLNELSHWSNYLMTCVDTLEVVWVYSLLIKTYPFLLWHCFLAQNLSHKMGAKLPLKIGMTWPDGCVFCSTFSGVIDEGYDWNRLHHKDEPASPTVWFPNEFVCWVSTCKMDR